MPEPIILPTTFNDDDNVVALFNIVVPETNNDDLNVTLLKLELPHKEGRQRAAAAAHGGPTACCCCCTLRVTGQKGDTRQLSHGANPAARVDANQIGRAGGQ